ncbi:MAG: PilZ domain-containing protein [Myxococcota bacterium]|nr:PilZ domain-containing protein [Myxococcota bacterium]
MQPRSYSPLIEAFLIIDQPRQRLSHWTQTLAPLDDAYAPPIAMITAYYDPIADQALLGLRYDELALGQERLAPVMEIALLAELGMIQPAELAEGERRRFLGERLSKCTLHVADQRSVVNALVELVRRIREVRAGAAKVLAPPLPRLPSIPAARAFTEPSGTADDPVLLVHPKSTRDDLDHAPAEPYLAKATRDTLRTATGEPPTRSRTTATNLIRHPSVHRAQTVQVPPIELQLLATEALVAKTPTSPTAVLGARGGAAVQQARGAGAAAIAPGPDRYMPTPPGPRNDQLPAGIIYARYLRSGRWVPIRIGSLNLKGAALMAGALPRLHDKVEIALSFGDHRALVHGPVNKVSSVQEAALSGAATFTVEFDHDDAARRQLVALLTAARAANVTIKPPPPRQARRYPVEWPVCLGTTRGAVRAEALDISRDGMFVRPHHSLTLDSKLTFSAVLDDGDVPISGRGDIVRHITETQARACGLVAGYGLRIIGMADDDRERWQRFLGRVEQRAAKRVLVGASPARLAEIQAGLAAAGYAVTGGTDAGALVQLAGAEHRPVDAALIDGGWLTPGSPVAWVESLFSSRNVPCITIHGDGRRARATVDKLLSVA